MTSYSSLSLAILIVSLLTPVGFSLSIALDLEVVQPIKTQKNNGYYVNTLFHRIRIIAIKLRIIKDWLLVFSNKKKSLTFDKWLTIIKSNTILFPKKFS